ncbi:COP9 signalosome complex subunit 4 [Vitis vinifera]|uniref:COP9 signalosome complex subunit 4 n=1 Tax=Vitis vinifera TaxID=29760 RepID=A0A438HUC0_VITVI|nr:COP9 signalosome complex subunit 4 [Vitis vinifera]
MTEMVYPAASLPAKFCMPNIERYSGVYCLKIHLKLYRAVMRAHRLSVLVIREKLAELYESEPQWSRAAQMLSGMDLDSTMRVIDDTLRLSKCIQIARLYLEDDDAVNAEAFINKASFLVSNSQHEVLNLQYKVCYARILDLKRKFLEAALRYYDISHIEKRQIGDELIDENSFRFLVPWIYHHDCQLTDGHRFPAIITLFVP